MLQFSSLAIEILQEYIIVYIDAGNSRRLRSVAHYLLQTQDIILASKSLLSAQRQAKIKIRGHDTQANRTE